MDITYPMDITLVGVRIGQDGKQRYRLRRGGEGAPVLERKYGDFLRLLHARRRDGGGSNDRNDDSLARGGRRRSVRALATLL